MSRWWSQILAMLGLPLILVIGVVLAQLLGGLTSSSTLECLLLLVMTESQYLLSLIGGRLYGLAEWCFVLVHSGS
jgi:hypothetical protein